MKSAAPTVEEYLASLPEDRRVVVTAVRALIREHLPEGYAEGMVYGMIGYYVPLLRYPTKNHQPLMTVALASQKNYLSLYLRVGKADWFQTEYAATGKKLDMGKGCLRFKKIDDLALDVIAKLVASRPVDALIAAEAEQD